MNKKSISIIAISILFSIILPLTVAAALPPVAEPQWNNVSNVVCTIDIGDDNTTAKGIIQGRTGSSIYASMTLYKTKNGTTTIVYADETPNNYASIRASFNYHFTPEIGATYRLELYGIVTLNGVDEVIQESDTVVFRDISLQ